MLNLMNIFLEILKFINLLISLLLLVNLSSVLIKQYYSLSRFYKVLINHTNYYLLFALIELIIIFIPWEILRYLLSILIGVFWLIKINKLAFKLSRRSILLITTSSLMVISFYFYPFVLINHLLSVLFVLSVSSLLLLPLEEIIKKHYIKKAREKINKFAPLIIGITGSFGKTSFKNHLITALSSKYVIGSPNGNINTLMGICKYINNQYSGEEILVLELGIDHKYQMERFKTLIKLDFAIITSVGNMHLATFKCVENVLIEKMKIKSLLKENGYLFINEDNEYLNKVDGPNIIKYSQRNVKILDFNIEGIKVEFKDQIYNFNVHQSFFTSYLDGIIKVCHMLNIEEENIYYLSNYFIDFKRRNEIYKTDKGYLIDNSYNANLKGIEDSINLLNTLEGDKLIITGGIKEQGKSLFKENEKLKDLLSNQQVIFVGENNHPFVKKHHFSKLLFAKNINDAYKLIKELSPNHILLLCKGDNIYLR